MRLSYLLIIVMIGLSGCQQKLYFPDRANSPMLSRAYEGKVTTAWKVQGNSSDSSKEKGGDAAFDLDAAFAPINHLGLIVSYRGLNRRRIEEDFGSLVDNYGGIFTGHRWEGGAGYFTKLSELERMEAYAGFGEGELVRRSSATPERDFNTRYRRYFVQAAFGATNKFFAASGGIRFAFQRYYNFTSPTSPDLRYHILDLDGPSRDVEAETFGFVEPFVNGEIGWKVLRFNLQLTFCRQFTGPSIAGNAPVALTMGATFHFDPDYFKPGGLFPKHRK